MTIIEIAGAGGHARLSAKGAQVLAATIGGDALLWHTAAVDDQVATAGQAIRGGVPLCFPWFGPRPGQKQHGFARISEWTVAARAGDSVTFALDDDEATRAVWPHRFHAELTATIGDALTLRFAVHNPDTAPFDFTFALHSYFAVPATATTRVDALAGRVRHVAGRAPAVQDGPVTLAEPIDAIFDDVPDRLELAAGATTIAVDATGMPSAVVWNPGPNELADIGAAWPEFVCVERGRIGAAAVTLVPGGRYTGTLRLSFA